MSRGIKTDTQGWTDKQRQWVYVWYRNKGSVLSLSFSLSFCLCLQDIKRMMMSAAVKEFGILFVSLLFGHSTPPLGLDNDTFLTFSFSLPLPRSEMRPLAPFHMSSTKLPLYHITIKITITITITVIIFFFAKFMFWKFGPASYVHPFFLVIFFFFISFFDRVIPCW